MLDSEKIKAIRLKLGYSQKDFGKKLDLSQSQIAGYESGYRSVPSKTWEAIHLLGISNSFIETGEGDMFTEIDTGERLGALLGKLIQDKDKEELKSLIIKLASLDEEYIKLISDLVDAIKK